SETPRRPAASRIAGTRVEANEALVEKVLQTRVLGQLRPVLIPYRKRDGVVVGRAIEGAREIEAPVHLRAAPRIGKEAADRTLTGGLVQTRSRARPHHRRERIADRAAAVHLDREIERTGARGGDESSERTRCKRLLRNAGKSRERHEGIEQRAEALEHPCARRQADERDVRAAMGAPQRAQRRHCTQHVSQPVQCSDDRDARRRGQSARTSSRRALLDGRGVRSIAVPPCAAQALESPRTAGRFDASIMPGKSAASLRNPGAGPVSTPTGSTSLSVIGAMKLRAEAGKAALEEEQLCQARIANNARLTARLSQRDGVRMSRCSSSRV